MKVTENVLNCNSDCLVEFTSTKSPDQSFLRVQTFSIDKSIVLHITKRDTHLNENTSVDCYI